MLQRNPVGTPGFARLPSRLKSPDHDWLRSATAPAACADAKRRVLGGVGLRSQHMFVVARLAAAGCIRGSRRPQLNTPESALAADVSRALARIYRSDTLQISTRLSDLYESMNDAQRAPLLRNVFQSIVLDHDGIAGFALRAPYANLFKGTPSDASPKGSPGTILAAA